MKKTISILLSIIIAFSSLSVGITAYAEECEHSYFTVKTIAPTCGKDGYTQQACKYCNNQQHINIVPATGEHNYINGVCNVCKAKDENYKEEDIITESIEITLDEPASISIPETSNYAYASFTPNEDGYYDFCGMSETLYYFDIIESETNKNIISNAFFNNVYKYTVQLKKDVKYLIKIYKNGKSGDISFVIKNHSHNFTVTKGKSTCSKESVNSYNCSGCGYSYTETNPIDPNNHYMSFDNGPVCKWCNEIQTKAQAIENEVNVLPTTNKSTYIYYSFVPESDGQYAVFTNCGSSIFLPYILDESYNVLNDKFYQQNKGSSAYPGYFSTGIVYDKFEAGKTYYIGIYCKDKITDDKNSFRVEKHEHNIYISSEVTATCNRDGYKIYKCTTCEYNEKTDIVPATNEHKYVNGKCIRCYVKNPDEIQTATITPEQSATLTSKYQNEDLIFNFTVDEEGYYVINYAVEPSENKIDLIIDSMHFPNNSIRHLNAGESLKIKCRCNTANTQVTLSATKHEHNYYVCYYNPQSCKENGCITYICSECRKTYNETIPYEQGVHYYFNGVCKCGQKDPEYQRIKGKLELDTKITIKEDFSNTKFTYEFTPNEYGFYRFYGNVEEDYYEDTTLNIYDKDYKIIKSITGGTKNHEIIIEIDKGETVYVEWLTGTSGTSTLLAQKHIHKTNDTIIAPSCNKLGYTKHVCTVSNCKHIYYDTYVPATGEHIFVETVHKPTCIEPGYTEAKCKKCGVGYAYDYVSAGNEYHKFKNGICEYCNAVDCDAEILNVKLNEKIELNFSSINDIKILSFTPSKTEIYTINPRISNIDVILYANDLNTYLDENMVAITTLLEANVQYFIVLRENTVYTEKSTFDITEHTHRYTSQTVAATCGDYGYVEYYCSVCNASRFVNYTEPTGKHRWVKDETVAPTCTENGYTAYYCNRCYEEKQDNIIPATNEHKYENGICIYCYQRKQVDKVDLGELIEGKATTVEYNDKDAFYSLTFKPSESATYLFKTTGTIDTYGKLLDSKGNVLKEDDDNALAYNFQIVYDLKKGEAYTIIIDRLDDDKDAFDVIVEKHTHDFAELDIPGDCGNDGVTVKTCKTCFEVYDIPSTPATNKHKYNEFGICTECLQFKSDNNIPVIKLFNETKVEKYNEGLFKFVASTDGEYTVYSKGDLAPIALFVDEKCNVIEQEIGQTNGFNINVSAKLKAGCTYYIISSAEVDEYSIVLSTKHEHKYEVVSLPNIPCNQKGYAVYRCTVCNEEKKELTNGAQHNYRDVVYAPSCVSQGYTESVCTICGYKLKHSFKAQRQHEFYVFTTLPTCTGKGYKTRYCINCDYECKYDYKNPTGHRWSDNYVVTKKATYASTGSRVRTCCDCGAKKNETIAKLKVAAPKSVSISARSKGFKASWKKNSSATGYQVQYSTSSNFKNAKTYTIKSNKTLSKTVSKLKGKKKYYVRVRCYKTYNKKNYYSSWTKAKAVTTKR